MMEFIRIMGSIFAAAMSGYMLNVALQVDRKDTGWKAFFYTLAAVNFVWFLKFVW